MCRPLWAAWVLGKEVVSVPGEGSHREMPQYYGRSKAQMLAGMVRIDPGTWHPFECRWPTERVARFQPQGDRFYALGDLPGKPEFGAAQAQLDVDMGSWEKLRDWVLAGAKLYGTWELVRTDVETDIASYRRDYTEPLWMAANRVLRTPLTVRGEMPTADESNRLFYPNARLTDLLASIYVAGGSTFTRWADAFSDRANRVDLWKN